MNTPTCPKCDSNDNIEMITVTFTFWEIDDEGNVGDIVMEEPDPSGDWAHWFCNTCDEAYGLDPQNTAGRIFEYLEDLMKDMEGINPVYHFVKTMRDDIRSLIAEEDD